MQSACPPVVIRRALLPEKEMRSAEKKAACRIDVFCGTLPLHQTFKERLATMKYLWRVLENSIKSPRFFWYILLFFIIVQAVQLTIGGCSHTQPYYHSDVPVSAKQDVEVENTLRYRVLLLGDGGDLKLDEPVLKTLGEWARKSPGKTSIVFLGDNMYPEGMTKEEKDEADARLGPQLKVVEVSTAHGLFIPGNHDWANGGKDGLSAIRAQEQFINDRLVTAQQRAPTTLPSFLPKDGCPGPDYLDLPPSAEPHQLDRIDKARLQEKASVPVVRLIVLNTQWWLHRHEKPQKDPARVIEELKAQLVTELPVIVVAHHPLKTYGKHGGFRNRGKQFLCRFLPLPPFKCEQDISGARNKNMVKQLNNAFSTPDISSFLIYAAGHDHSLQVLKGSIVDYLLVSGAASSKKLTAVGHGDNTLFAHQHSGFMAIDFLADGKILLRVVEPEGKGVVFHYWLKR